MMIATCGLMAVGVGCRAAAPAPDPGPTVPIVAGESPIPAEDPVPRFVDAPFIDIDAIARISKFRSGVGHDYGDDFEHCRSMKHYFEPRADVDWSTVAIAAPMDGTVDELREEWAGTQVAIRADAAPDYTVVIFHVRLDPPLVIGDRVAAGQRLGTHIGSQTMSDIAIRRQMAGGMRLVSYFDVMSDEVLETFRERGLTARADAIIGRAERDGRPLHCAGDRFVDPASDVDWAVLGSPP